MADPHIFKKFEFTNDDMEIVASAFQTAFKTLMDQYLDEEQVIALKIFITRVVVEEKPYVWVSAEGQEHVHDMIFIPENVRDFVMALTFMFFARWGEANVKFTGLVDTLSWGSSADTVLNDDSQYVLMPQAISSRLASHTDVKKYLTANKWLITLMLIKLFIVPESTAGRQRSNGS